MENNILLDSLVLKILVFFAGIVAFLLTERRFAFDLKQKIKIFVGFFIIAYIGLLMIIVILSSLAEWIGGK